jgi:hypothetical protein
MVALDPLSFLSVPLKSLLNNTNRRSNEAGRDKNIKILFPQDFSSDCWPWFRNCHAKKLDSDGHEVNKENLA